MADEKSNDLNKHPTSELSSEIEDEIAEELGAELSGDLTEEIKEKIKAKVRAELEAEIKAQVERGEIPEIGAELEAAAVPEKIIEEKIEEEEQFQRFNLNIRIQHIVLFSSVFLLIFTGIPLRFHNAGFAIVMLTITGGINGSRIIHRIAASGLILVGIYHLLYTVLSRSGRRDFIELLPTLKDVRDLFIMIKYFLGRCDEQPELGRFGFVEKFDYWAVYWGMVIMIGSGLLLWFDNISMRLFPKFLIDIAKEMHRDEALLAILSIIFWHFYHVHLNPHKFPMNFTWWTGKISREDIIREHPLEYEKIMKERDE